MARILFDSTGRKFDTAESIADTLIETGLYSESKPRRPKAATPAEDVDGKKSE
ncbi:hypothetical protein SAMN04515671_2922 [Nakamurella panacisegetis]|uniref:Uncharacterized protein n=1 Tax=Nakamurella panacisegetis TaxID=1090615 RepID=A0A1H0PX47_9ACTN|nr:hypothetical protein [Nakamurella panacisegetis]SDP09390.1 hypothetical protein SAMN04515671_2922 [Nakamurella panacisegetis]